MICSENTLKKVNKPSAYSIFGHLARGLLLKIAQSEVGLMSCLAIIALFLKTRLVDY